MLSKHLREIEKSASNILGGNWRFFYNFNNKKYPLSKEKVIGELLVYLIISNNQNLYKRIFSEGYNIKKCFQRLHKMEKASPNIPQINLISGNNFICHSSGKKVHEKYYK
ncbi:hypothetical protein EFR34_06505 [Lactobacillus delbrueckii subsp. lactis]|nr:hypothetical protein [Lactobacillus delbrueckii subsp. lactis]